MDSKIYGTLDDKMLVSLVKSGETDAYETLVLRHQKKVLAQAIAVTRNQSLAEDAAQDAFITAWLKLDMLGEPAKFGAWVKMIARRRAVDLIARMRSYVGIEELAEFADHDADVSERIIEAEQYEELRRSVVRLPEKLGEVIRLHYFEGLSVAEISDRIKTPAGTVKWRLSEGRRKLRGDLSALTEKENDTLVEKVMKKVAELRLWRLRNDFYGFDEAYADVMADVDAMPESKEKYAAKAEVMMMAWQYRPDYKNTFGIDDIREAALAGECEAAIKFIADKDESGRDGKELIDYINGTALPFMREHGFRTVEAYEQYKLACEYADLGDMDHAVAARDAVFALVQPDDTSFAATKALFSAIERYDAENDAVKTGACELRYVGGDLVLWGARARGMWGAYNRGKRYYHWDYAFCIDNLPELCGNTESDSRLYIDGARVGDVFTFAGGGTLKFAGDNETVVTPAGTFEECEAWENVPGVPNDITTVYYKRGVGIVKIAVTGLYDYAFELADFTVKGGSGRLPLAAGNRWEYVKTGYYNFDCRDTLEVTSADGCGAVLAYMTKRTPKKTPTWDSVMFEISNQYADDDNYRRLIDMSEKLDQLDSLASTEFERTVSAMARTTMERIWRGDHPESREGGVWNFFQINAVEKAGTETYLDDRYRWQHSFEWKCGDNEKCLHNKVYDILGEVAGRLFSERWLDGKPHVYRRFSGWKRVESTVTAVPASDVTTAAGTFSDCIDVHIVERELENLSGQSYRGGEMTYTFARGVGIVRAVHETGIRSVYELSSFEGVGEGYMPLAADMRRRYDCVNPDRGYYAYADYAVVTSPSGRLALVADLGSQRRLPDKATADVRGLVELMKKDYCKHLDNGEEKLADVSDIIALLPERARCGYDKTLAEYASRVMTRIFDTDAEANPARTVEGKWNFFCYYNISTKNGRTGSLCDDRTYAFEWKDVPVPKEQWQMLYTFMFDILSDNVGCLWDNAWEIGREYSHGGTKFALSREGEITTDAGTFSDCVKLTVDARGMDVNYFNGRREFYFANGVGIVRFVNHMGEGEPDVVYELSSYSGASFGYMSAEPGTRRHYELIDPAPGVIASIDAAFEIVPETNEPVMLVDQCGCVKV